jgi:hypothetical protein
VFCLLTSPSPILAQWVQTTCPATNQINCFAEIGTKLFAGTFGNGIFLSTNNGTNWTQINTSLDYDSVVIALAVLDTTLFAGTNNTFGWVDIFLSTNNGTSWAIVDNGLDANQVSCLAVEDTNLFLGTSNSAFRFGNSTKSWTKVDSGLGWPIDITGFAISPNGSGGTNLFTVSEDSVFLSTNSGASWTATADVGLASTVGKLAVSPAAGGTGSTNLFAGTGDGVYLSTNNGASWTAVNSGMTNYYQTFAFAVSGTNIFVAELSKPVQSQHQHRLYYSKQQGAGSR